MRYDIDTAKTRAALDDLIAQVAAENAPEARAARAAAERSRKYARVISYGRQCDAGDAVVLGAKKR